MDTVAHNAKCVRRSASQKAKAIMDVVNLQMVKGAPAVWTFAWTVKLLASGQVKDVAHPVKKAAKVGAKEVARTHAKEIVNLHAKEIASLLVRGLAKLLHRKIELRTVQEELMFQTR